MMQISDVIDHQTNETYKAFPKAEPSSFGLEYLAMMDDLIIQQKVELLEAVTGFETANEYKLLDTSGNKIFSAKEKTDILTRSFWGSCRPFEINILNNQGEEVLHLVRPLNCCSLQELEVIFLERKTNFVFVYQSPFQVQSHRGTVIGSVKQQPWSFFYPNLLVKNETGDPVLRIDGPLCVSSCFGDVIFTLRSLDSGEEVGKITKNWSGLGKEAFTDEDNFAVSFPQHIDVKVDRIYHNIMFSNYYLFSLRQH